MSKHKLFKLGAAAALSVTGVSAMTSFKTVHAADLVTIKQVRINYLPGKSLRIWTSYKKVNLWYVMQKMVLYGM